MDAGVGRDPEQLLRLAWAENGPALGQLLELYRNYLTLLARLKIGRQLQGKVDAADLVQETFLEAHRQFPRFQGTAEGEFLGWLRQILAGNIAHLIRRYCGTQRRDVRLERQLEEELEQASHCFHLGLVAKQSSPSQRAVRREQSVLLADALENLPEDYREVILLRHVQGLSFPDVARHMGRSVARVEKLWIRALDRLRHLLPDTL
jgi:RNA polymerase sigma-70 factor (ECF subfamily)